MVDTYGAIEPDGPDAVLGVEDLPVREVGPAVGSDGEKERRSFFGRFRRNKQRKAEKLPPPNGMDGEPGDLKRRITLMQPHSYATEQFRTLRGRIDALAAQRPICSVAVTSPNPGEGKSTASVSLAIVSAMSVGRKVLLIDSDMRRPTVHRALDLDPKAGIAEVLSGEATLGEAVVRFEEGNMDVLCVAERPGNPSELLASQRMREVMEEVAGRYDRIVVDTPVTLGLPDAKVVSDLCDGVVLVIRSGSTPLRDIESCVDLLDRRRVLGLVLNAIDGERDRYTYE